MNDFQAAADMHASVDTTQEVSPDHANQMWLHGLLTDLVMEGRITINDGRRITGMVSGDRL